MSLADRRTLGPLAHRLKTDLTQQIEERKKRLRRESLQKKLQDISLDSSLPGVPCAVGSLHPITQVEREIVGVLSRLGFSVAQGPILETDEYNFQALNIPPDHPARDLQDTFYLADHPQLLLRTHTSPVQIRMLRAHRPPLRIAAPGRVFRHEATDASHGAVFHQVEGLYVDRRVCLADLKSTLAYLFRELLGPSTLLRFRPSYFPFTEPSAELDVGCLLCGGQGCSVCKKSGWLEMLGAGMVHPKVFEQAGYSGSEWSGFAFGMSVERLAMLKLRIPDIRLLYENDMRFLEQF